MSNISFRHKVGKYDLCDLSKESMCITIEHPEIPTGRVFFHVNVEDGVNIVDDGKTTWPVKIRKLMEIWDNATWIASDKLVIKPLMERLQDEEDPLYVSLELEGLIQSIKRQQSIVDAANNRLESLKLQANALRQWIEKHAEPSCRQSLEKWNGYPRKWRNNETERLG